MEANANDGWNKLNYAMRTLSEKWDSTEAGWRDRKRIEFEKTCMHPLESQVETTLRAMKHLSETLSRVYRECRDDSE